MKKIIKIITILFIGVILISVIGIFVIAQQEPEVIENLTHTSYQTNTVDLGNGKFAQTSYLGFVNYYNGSEFMPINTTLIPYNFDGYDYAMTKSVYHLYIKSHSNWGDGVKYCVEDNGTEYCLTYQSQDYSYRDKYGSQDYISSIVDKVGIVNGSSIMYPDVFPNVSLSYSVFNSMIKENYILKSRPRIPATYLATPITLDFGGYIKFPNLIMQVNGSNMSGNFITQEQIDFVHDGEVLFYLPKPYAYDSNDNSINLQYEVKTQKQEIWFYVKTPYSWLNDSSRVYPVYIDPSTGYMSPGTTVDVAFGTKLWNWPERAQSSDDSYATAFGGVGGGTSHYLKATNFGAAIPSGATIDGIVVEFERYPNAANLVYDFRIYVGKTGGVFGDENKAAAGYWSTTQAYYSYGGVADLWSETWTAEDINNAAFGLSISVHMLANGVAYIDHIRITVYYTPVTNTQINIGDNWKDVTEIYINIGDAWKTVSNVYINIGDNWKTVY